MNRTSCCDLCTEDDAVKSNTFSFVWISFITIGLCGIAWFTVICKTCFDAQTKEIVKSFHPTISSYMADHRKSINNYTFLLLTTILISLNLLALYTEEFNARSEENDTLWLYLLECSAFLAFSLVGIFHIKGNNITQHQKKHRESDAIEHAQLHRQDTELTSISISNKELQSHLMYDENENDEKYCEEHTELICGCGIDGDASEWIHSLCYAYFLIIITGTNSFYVIMLHIDREKHTECKGWNMFFLVLDILNIILLILFGIFYCLITSKIPSSFNLRNENGSDWRRKIRMTSFYIQIASGIGIVLLTMLSSLKRNSQFAIFCENNITS